MLNLAGVHSNAHSKAHSKGIVLRSFVYLFGPGKFFYITVKLFLILTWFFVSSTRNAAASYGNYVTNSFQDPKRTKFDEQSGCGHVQQDQNLIGCVPEATYEYESFQNNSTLFYMQV